jgi:putative FmdB family regulatory protein
MPMYEFKCKDGHITTELMSFHAAAKSIQCHACGKKAKRIISLPNTDVVENIRFSEAMGVNVEQIPEAMRTFPGSEYHPETGALKITSRKDKLRKMKERGYVEY